MRTLLPTLLLPGCAPEFWGESMVWATPEDIPLGFTPEGIDPWQLRLVQGRPVRLVLSNRDATSRALTAPGFFATVATRPGEGMIASAGGIDVPVGATRRVVLMPLVAGSWRLEGIRRPFPDAPPAAIIVESAAG